jgi:hypothetical protein
VTIKHRWYNIFMEHDLFGKPVSTFPDHCSRYGTHRRRAPFPNCFGLRSANGLKPSSSFEAGSFFHTGSDRNDAIQLHLDLLAPK